MAPELVVVPGGDTHKIYPGGVIAVKAAEFLGPARGTLSTEANALASTGTVVRDSQQVASVNTPFLDDDSYQNADDTLVIPAADIGIEDGFNYRLYITILVEGEWDLTNEPLLRECSNLVYQSVVSYGAHGTVFEPEASPNWDSYALCRIPYFQVVHLRLNGIETTDTLRFRFYSQSGTTAEILIDQIVFQPRALSPDWLANQDIRDVGTNSLSNVTDGADGGDDNGKYTRYPTVNVDSFFQVGGSSDFQRKADGDDAEYHQRITESANEILLNSVTDTEAAAHGYGLYCARYRGPITYSEDTFDNRSTSTTGQDMGIDEAGYGWAIGTSASGSDPDCFVDSGVAVMRINAGGTLINPRWGDEDSQGAAASTNQGAALLAYDEWQFSGEVENTAGSIDAGRLRIFSFHDVGDTTWEIRINVTGAEWELGRWNGSTFTNLGSTHDISSWWGLNSPLGFRLVVARYTLRCRVWDATGAEPSTWDEELFKPSVSGGVQVDYDYAGLLALANRGYQKHNWFGFQLDNISGTGSFPYDITIHNVKFEHDPYGDPADMSARMERPDGTSLGDIVVPYGSAHWVYWGKHDWTDPDAGTWKIEFAERVWNDPAAAELQRAETSMWYFRSVHFNPDLVPMNWRSGERQGGVQGRVLYGSR